MALFTTYTFYVVPPGSLYPKPDLSRARTRTPTRTRTRTRTRTPILALTLQPYP